MDDKPVKNMDEFAALSGISRPTIQNILMIRTASELPPAKKLKPHLRAMIIALISMPSIRIAV